VSLAIAETLPALSLNSAKTVLVPALPVSARRERPNSDEFPPLSLAEADSFLRDLLKKWLRWKLDQQNATR
jgi:hypothetical protein